MAPTTRLKARLVGDEPPLTIGAVALDLSDRRLAPAKHRIVQTYKLGRHGGIVAGMAGLAAKTEHAGSRMAQAVDTRKEAVI